MSIVKMKKLQLAGIGSEKKALLRKLQKLGCVELRPSEAREGYLSPIIGGPREEQLAELRKRRNDAEEALKALKKYAYVKSGLFPEKELISETDFFADIRADALRAVGNVLEAEQALSQRQEERASLLTQREGLLLWQDLAVPLEQRETRSARIWIGSIPANRTVEELERALEEAGVEAGIRPAGQNRERCGLLAVGLKGEAERFEAVLRDFGYEAAPTAALRGTAQENISRFESEADQAARDGEETKAFLKDCGKHRRLIRLWSDRLGLEIDALEAEETLLCTQTAFALTGWVDEPHVPALEALLENYCCAWELSDPREGDKIPVRLQNNALTRPLNMVTEMYSLPDYRNVDPNPLIAPFFCVYFGMMFNDLGYGLVFIVLSLLVQKKFRLQRGMKNMMQLMLECGVTTAVFGILTGSFFGDAVTQIASLFGRTAELPALIRPMDNPLQILIISLALGVFQILFGMGIKAYILIRDGHPLDALMDVGSWWLLFAGIAVGAMGGTWFVAIAGVLALVLTQGRAKPTFVGKLVGGVASLYDITSYFSDVLSYSRIMALMLAGGIVASIVNILGGLFGNIFMFIPIFIIGHVFNIGINVIGTYVHSARLQYLEFFGKFYADGGKAFRPLEVKTKYFDIVEEEVHHV
ncbi:MAG: V-type ATP synthase subunit I [Oscillospiraceae bacterium]|nr:V-type ATP synthase subunit I [Oscillospiraceae bacterium]